jgi:hypothetical protein
MIALEQHEEQPSVKKKHTHTHCYTKETQPHERKSVIRRKVVSVIKYEAVGLTVGLKLEFQRWLYIGGK